jgi:hypothetical protein
VSIHQSPEPGKPFNFSNVLDCVLIPRVIAADSTLLPGARLLWGVIRQRSWRDGICTASDQTLAEEIGVSDRAVRKYVAQLTAAGLLVSSPRPGLTAARQLCWAERFIGTVSSKLSRPSIWDQEQARPRPEKTALGVERAYRPPGTGVPPPRNGRAAPLRNRGSSLVVPGKPLPSGVVDVSTGAGRDQQAQAPPEKPQPNRGGALKSAADILRGLDLSKPGGGI